MNILPNHTLLFKNLWPIVLRCGSEYCKIAIPAQEKFIEVIEPYLQYAIEEETDTIKDNDIDKISGNLYNNLTDIGAAVMLPSEDFTNLRYDKIEEMLVVFKNSICKKLKDDKILFYGNVHIYCDENVHKHKQVGIYGWCEGTTINPLAENEDKFNKILKLNRNQEVSKC